MRDQNAFADHRWWQDPDDVRPHTSVLSTVRRIHSNQGARLAALDVYMRMYGESAWRSSRVSAEARNAQLSLNVVRNMVDSVQAETIMTQPRPMFLTSGGDYTLQRRAEQLGKYTDGLFYLCHVDKKAPAVCRDAEVLGTGIAKVFEQNGRVAVDRVFPGELYVDEEEGRYGEPRSMYQTKYFDRHVLAEMFPDFEAEILDAPAPSGDWALGYNPIADQVLVTEAWRLPSSDEAKDGRHVLCIDNATLVTEAWEDDDFPFVFLHWSEPMFGFWGRGLAEQLRGIQREINRILLDIQAAMKLAGVFRIFIRKGSIVKTHLNNEPGSMVEYLDTPPVFAPSAVIPQEMLDQLERLYQKAYEVAGVSQLSAQSMKPAGLDSGRALRVYADIQSKRFLRFGRAYEAFHIGLAKQMIRLTRRLAKDDASFEVVYRSKTQIERIKWGDVDIEESEYVLQCYPTSALPNTPAGKFAALQELVNSGFAEKVGWDSAEILRLLDFPDLESARNLTTAPRDLADERIGHMLETGEYLAPEPFFDLALHTRVAVLSYQRAQIQGVPESRLDLLRQYIAACDALLNPPPPPVDPAAAAAMPAPPAGPMPPGPGPMPPGGPPPGEPMPMPPPGPPPDLAMQAPPPAMAA